MGAGTIYSEETLFVDFTQTGYPLCDDHWVTDLATKSARRRPGLPGRPRSEP